MFEYERKIEKAWFDIIELELRMDDVYNGKRSMDIEEIRTIIGLTKNAKDLLAQVILELDIKHKD